jgi:hypothetical protein
MSVVTKEMLDAAVILGRNQEREHIIQLLDELHYESGQISHITNRLDVCKTCQAIALIKGTK